jgi:hypothetical protein
MIGRAILRAKEDGMGELCEHQKQAGTWTVEVRPPNYECIFCHVDRLEALLRESYHALREPENGVHYCRGCDAGTHNAWKHAPACPLENRGADVIRLRSKIREAIGDPAAR